MADDTRSDETVEERRKRRIEEARAKLKAKQEAGEAPKVEASAAPPAEETVEERRERRIAEARAKMAAKPSGEPAPSPAPVSSPGPAGTKRVKGGVERSDLTDDPLVRRLRERFGDGVESAVAMVGQRIVTLARAVQPDAMRFLKTAEPDRFDLLLDVTAVHRPEEEPPFEVVYQLCSTRTLARLRVKVRLADGESVPSVVAVWPGANWLERECYDMFGIVFDGHPDLRRILLPEGWEGHPLRKEYPVEFRENRWVRENLRITELPVDADFTGKFEV